jgi:hypothetical protein
MIRRSSAAILAIALCSISILLTPTSAVPQQGCVFDHIMCQGRSGVCVECPTITVVFYCQGGFYYYQTADCSSCT